MYDALYDLRDNLCKQLVDYGKKGELSAAILERVDMLAHATKNLDKVIEKCEEDGAEYSGSMNGNGGRSYRGNGGSYDRGSSYRDDGRSMARGRGSNARRDSMGRYSSDDGYSRHGDTMDQLRDMADAAEDERTRQEINRLVTRLENR